MRMERRHRDWEVEQERYVEELQCSEAFRKEYPLWELASLARYIREQEENAKIVERYSPPKGRKVVYQNAGPTKKLARIALYEEVSRLDSRFNRFLILSGGEPQHEVTVIRHLFPESQIIAFDLDSRAIAKAKGVVDLACHMDVGELRLAGPRRSPIALVKPYRLANLDFCGLVNSDGVGAAFNRAAMLSEYVATWFSFGHEKGLHDITSTAAALSAGVEGVFSALPKTIRDRLLFAYLRCLQEGPQNTFGWFNPSLNSYMNAVKVWTYRDKSMPMFCVLWKHIGLVDGAVEFARVAGTEADIRRLVMTAADRDSAARYYGVDKNVLAAWKAVETREVKRCDL